MISVIVPVYNAMKHLSNLLFDLENQTYKDFEAILVDNNSTDGSYELLCDKAKETPYLKVIRETKQGPNYARKRGFNESSGDFLYFFDSDDRILPNTLEILYNKMIESHSDVVIGNYCEVDEAGMITKYCKGINFDSKEIENLKQDKRIFFIKMPLWNKMFKRNCINENYFVFSNIGEDMLLSLCGITKGLTVTYVDKEIYHYLVTDNGLSYTVNLKNITGIVDTCRHMDIIFKNEFNHCYDEEIEYIQIQHLLYRLLRSTLLSKKEQIEARKVLIPYIKEKDYTSNTYFRKSYAFRMAYQLLVSERMYIVNKGILKFIFKNKTLNKIFKKLDK